MPSAAARRSPSPGMRGSPRLPAPDSSRSPILEHAPRRSADRERKARPLAADVPGADRRDLNHPGHCPDALGMLATRPTFVLHALAPEYHKGCRLSTTGSWDVLACKQNAQGLLNERPLCVCVGKQGFEPWTSRSRTVRASQLRYSPSHTPIILSFPQDANPTLLLGFPAGQFVSHGLHQRGRAQLVERIAGCAHCIGQLAGQPTVKGDVLHVDHH